MDGMLSQEEINALFSGMDLDDEPADATSDAGASEELLTPEEQRGAKKTLRAAAMTYVAAVAVSLAQLLRLILLFGGRGRRRD